jgi:phage terminase small subunit
MTLKKLRPKQKKFVQEYLVDLNATQAAIRAGYAPKRADATAYNLLRNTEVQVALQKYQNQLAEKVEVTIEELVIAYKQIAFADLADCYDENGFLKNIHEIPLSARMALAGLEVDELYEGRGKDRECIGQTKKVKLWDKLRALDALGRHLGLFNADTSQKPGDTISTTKIEVVFIRSENGQD